MYVALPACMQLRLIQIWPALRYDRSGEALTFEIFLAGCQGNVPQAVLCSSEQGKLHRQSSDCQAEPGPVAPWAFL